MICPTCEAAGVQSRVIEGTKTVRSPDNELQFYDEGGEFHRHSTYSLRTPFRCSAGHTWEHHSAVRCPTCGVIVDPKGQDAFGRPVAPSEAVPEL